VCAHPICRWLIIINVTIKEYMYWTVPSVWLENGRGVALHQTVCLMQHAYVQSAYVLTVSTYRTDKMLFSTSEQRVLGSFFWKQYRLCALVIIRGYVCTSTQNNYMHVCGRSDLHTPLWLDCKLHTIQVSCLYICGKEWIRGTIKGEPAGTLGEKGCVSQEYVSHEVCRKP